MILSPSQIRSPPFLSGKSQIKNQDSFFGHNQCMKSRHIKQVLLLTIDNVEISAFLKYCESQIGSNFTCSNSFVKQFFNNEYHWELTVRMSEDLMTYSRTKSSITFIMMLLFHVFKILKVRTGFLINNSAWIRTY